MTFTMCDKMRILVIDNGIAYPNTVKVFTITKDTTTEEAVAMFLKILRSEVTAGIEPAVHEIAKKLSRSGKKTSHGWIKDHKIKENYGWGDNET